MQEMQFVDPILHVSLTHECQGYRSTKGFFFPVKNGIPTFISEEFEKYMTQQRSGLLNKFKTALRHFPLAYIWLAKIFGPVCFTGLSARKFLRRFDQSHIVVNLGAGVHRYGKSIINVDIFPYVGVDIVADALATPFPTNSIDGLVCEYLLEHVPDPSRIIQEILRVLKPGGFAYIAIPFMYPFHDSPNDYYRWSEEGLRQLCRNAKVVQHGIRCGPTSALVAQITTWLAIVFSFGSKTLYSAFSILFLLLTFPFKYFDLILQFFPTSSYGAACCYIVICKQNEINAI